jgi:type IV secretory pathway protease TraF
VISLLPHLEGCTIVADGEVVLASTAPRSLDARYFGLTRVATLTARAVPLLTWSARW